MNGTSSAHVTDNTFRPRRNQESMGRSPPSEMARNRRLPHDERSTEFAPPYHVRTSMSLSSPQKHLAEFRLSSARICWAENIPRAQAVSPTVPARSSNHRGSGGKPRETRRPVRLRPTAGPLHVLAPAQGGNAFSTSLVRHMP